MDVLRGTPARYLFECGAGTAGRAGRGTAGNARTSPHTSSTRPRRPQTTCRRRTPRTCRRPRTERVFAHYTFQSNRQARRDGAILPPSFSVDIVCDRPSLTPSLLGIEMDERAWSRRSTILMTSDGSPFGRKEARKPSSAATQSTVLLDLSSLPVGRLARHLLVPSRRMAC